MPAEGPPEPVLEFVPKQPNKPKERRAEGSAGSLGAADFIVSDEMDVDRDLKELDSNTMVIMLKLLLQQGFSMREVQSGIMNVFLSNIENALITSLKSTGQWYSQKVQGNAGHGLGPPLPHVALTLIKFCVQKAVCSQMEMKHLQDKLEEWDTEEEPMDTRRAIFDSIPILRLGKAHTPKGEPQNYKLMIRVTDVKLKKALFATFDAIHLERKLGMAPRGALERLLQLKLDKMTKKGGEKGDKKGSEKKGIAFKKGSEKKDD